MILGTLYGVYILDCYDIQTNKKIGYQNEKVHWHLQCHRPPYIGGRWWVVTRLLL